LASWRFKIWNTHAPRERAVNAREARRKTLLCVSEKGCSGGVDANQK
jgi:hypothetical protein